MPILYESNLVFIVAFIKFGKEVQAARPEPFPLMVGNRM